MTYRIQVNILGVSLPDGGVYNTGDSVLLTDEEYAKLIPRDFSSGFITDLGAVGGGAGITGTGGGALATSAQIAADAALTGAFASIVAAGPAVGSDAWLKAWAPSVADNSAVGAIVVNGDGVATSFGVEWPNGIAGVFTATTVNSTWLTVDAWTLTYAATIPRTVTQAAVTRDGGNGAVTVQPALTVGA